MEKKKIAFIEMETHSALLEQWYLLLVSMPSVSFHFFVHPKVNDKLTSIPSEFITVVDSASNLPIQDFDAVVINTLHRNFKDYKTIFETKPVLCLVHNLNFSILFKGISVFNFIKEKERLLYYMKLYLKERIWSGRKVILKAKQFGVLSLRLQYEIIRKSKLEDKSQLIQMNYCKDKEFHLEHAEVIEIVIPGNVSNKRKNLDVVFSVLRQLKPKSKLHFTFLGKPENRKILKALEKIKKNAHANITISYFDRFIPWEEYSEVVSKAHLLLCPIRHRTSFYGVNEYYGQTKVSGSEADCIYNGKVGIFPSTYPKMDWYNQYYEKESSLAKLLNSLTMKKVESEYESLKPYLGRYAFAKVQATLEQQLINLTKENV